MQVLGVSWGAAVGSGGFLAELCAEPTLAIPHGSPRDAGRSLAQVAQTGCKKPVGVPRAVPRLQPVPGSAGFCTHLHSGAFPTHPCVPVSLGRHPGELLPSHSWANPVLIPTGAVGRLWGRAGDPGRGSAWSCASWWHSQEPGLPLQEDTMAQEERGSGAWAKAAAPAAVGTVMTAWGWQG